MPASGSTVGALLTDAIGRLRASGSDTARLDAELLLGHVLGIERTGVIAQPEAPVGPATAAAFEAALARREQGEPVAYIRGLKEFHGLAFGVDARALIPRPETELLVGLAERLLVDRLTSAPRPPGTRRLRVLDVGTGAGAVVVALAVLLRRRGMLDAVALMATDRSADALTVARENAVGHGVADVIAFVEADLVEDGIRADLVVANLPYIPSAEVDRLPVAASFEPRLALDGGPDGLDLVRRLVARLPEILDPGATALLEIGADQAEALPVLLAGLPGAWSAELHRDLGGRPRVAAFRRPAEDDAPEGRLVAFPQVG